MAKFPIISDLDWLQLHFIEAETSTEALIKAATEWVDSCVKECQDAGLPIGIRLDPDGVKGSCTPNQTLVVQQLKTDKIEDGWELESTWTSPWVHGDQPDRA